MRWCQTLGQKAGLIADLTIPYWGVGAFARCPPWQLESAMHMATTFGHGGKVYEVPSELMFLKSPSGPSRRRLRHHRPVLGCYR
jgi:hypothetical protein